MAQKKLVKITKLTTIYDRYDLVVKKNHNFIASGVVVHNSSAHISYDIELDEMRVGNIFPRGKHSVIHFFSGGAKHEDFVKLFNQEYLLSKFTEMYNGLKIIVYGEVYGGKIQKMSDTYGKEMRFVAFDVKIGHKWLSVPQAESVVELLGLEFVFYLKTSTDLETLKFERDRNSEQAIRNHMGLHPSEGIVIRPLIELTKNNGERLIAKYKKEAFRETRSPRPVNAEKIEILKNAEAIATEWVTEMRLNHVVNALNVEIDTVNIPIIIRGMLEDIRREGADEIEWSKEVDKAIGKATAQMVKNVCKNKLGSIA